MPEQVYGFDQDGVQRIARVVQRLGMPRTNLIGDALPMLPAAPATAGGSQLELVQIVGGCTKPGHFVARVFTLATGVVDTDDPTFEISDLGTWSSEIATARSTFEVGTDLHAIDVDSTVKMYWAIDSGLVDQDDNRVLDLVAGVAIKDECINTESTT